MSNLQIYRGIEDEVTPEIIKDPLVEEVIKHLEEFDFKERILPGSLEFKNLIECRQTLNPTQILDISKYMKKLEENSAKIKYLNILIQTSYNLGNNDFIIDNKQETWLASFLKGISENNLEIKILSNTGILGWRSNYCHITAEQNVKDTGRCLTNCYVEIKQDLESLFINHSYNSTFKIRGQIKTIELNVDTDGTPRYDDIKLILNLEEYRKYEYLKKYPQITLEVLKE